MSLTKAQLEMRRSGLGASDLPALVGLSTWLTPSKLYKQKVDGEEMPTNAFMDRGIALEGKVLDRYAEVYGVRLVDVGTVRHATRPLLMATPDGVVEGVRVVEVKVPSTESDQWGAPGTDLCPASYIVQCQAQMACLDLPEAHLVRPAPGEDPNSPGFKLHIYTIPRDRELWEWLAAVAETWWQQHVATRTPPPNFRKSKPKEKQP